MKYILILSALFFYLPADSQVNNRSGRKAGQQPVTTNKPATKLKSSGNEIAIETSEIKNNKPATVNTQQQTAGQQPAKTKLDDLKNPFDSTKKVRSSSKGLQNTSNSQKETPIQNPGGGVQKTKLDDLKNPFDSTKKVVTPKAVVQPGGGSQKNPSSANKSAGRRTGPGKRN